MDIVPSDHREILRRISARRTDRFADMPDPTTAFCAKVYGKAVGLGREPGSCNGLEMNGFLLMYCSPKDRHSTSLVEELAIPLQFQGRIPACG